MVSPGGGSTLLSCHFKVRDQARWAGSFGQHYPASIKSFDEGPAFIMSRMHHFFCLGGGGLNKVFYTRAGCAPSLVYTIFYRKGTPFVRPSNIEGRGGGGGYACPLFWISKSVVLPFWDRRSLFHLALCGCFKVMSLSECYQQGRASLVYLLLTNGTPLTPPSQRRLHPF